MSTLDKFTQACAEIGVDLPPPGLTRYGQPTYNWPNLTAEVWAHAVQFVVTLPSGDARFFVTNSQIAAELLAKFASGDHG